MSKLERLLNLTAVLLDTTRPLSAEELRTRVEGYPPPGPSFRRSFERDKDDLRVLGIPIRVERVPGTDPPVDGYRIPPEEYYLPDPGLDTDELAALHLASLAVRLDGFGDDEALWKLGGVTAPASGPVADSMASLPTDRNLVPLFSAITSRRLVEFEYRGERRTVEPWRLDFQRGRWYLTGFDRLRDDERNFRIDRVEGDVAVTGEPGAARRSTAPGPGRRLQGWEIGDEQPVDVELLVDETRVAWASQQLGPTVSSRAHPDGGTVFTIPVVNEDAFRSFVFGFLEHAEVVGPPDIRHGVVDWLTGITES